MAKYEKRFHHLNETKSTKWRMLEEQKKKLKISLNGLLTNTLRTLVSMTLTVGKIYFSHYILMFE